LVKEHEETLCAGRTHGMHAEPTSFGLKMAGYLAELNRNELRLQRAVSICAIAKLSGAVGTYSTQSVEVEKGLCQKLKLVPETIATQVIPRDRHAEVFFALAMLGSGIERLAVELRHLQRTEVGEVVEGFSPGQKGSSAMPHKKNPISAENMTGAARLLRSYLQAAMENISLWHERDISHSSVERVIFPDAFILCDYAVDRMASVLDNLFVDKERMLQNMELSGGHLYSSHVLLALVDGGLSREEAYKLVQSHAHGLKANQSLRESLLLDEQVTELVSKEKLNEIFSGETHRQAIKALLGKIVL
ncbi:MAG: adenylosuccinate lyase, partial [Bdellovibrionales bacterium]|nr:adenylosuccinate lyase [Bdellovibrionales bacterium]